MSKDPDVDKLNEALVRLAQENAAWRTKVDEAFTVIRQRASNADGLTLEAAIKTILNERDNAQDRVQFFREELRAILQYLISSEDNDSKKTNEIRKRINLFLFNNPR